MKAIKVALNVATLVFMQKGVIMLGAYLGEVLRVAGTNRYGILFAYRLLSYYHHYP